MQPLEPPDEMPWPADAIEVGRIVGAWGVKGWVRVHPHSNDPKALFSTRRWLVESVPADRRHAAAPPRRSLRIAEAREHGDSVVAKFDGCDDRAAAEAFQGALVHVPRSRFPTASDGEFYWVDLIGLEVVNREGIALGAVHDLLDTGAHCVLRIAPPFADERKDERLVPFVAAHVDDVDLGSRRIVVDWHADD